MTDNRLGSVDNIVGVLDGKFTAVVVDISINEVNKEVHLWWKPRSKLRKSGLRIKK